MDLVKSYDSDMDGDSDIEEIQVSTTKQVDVIDLDSDSADETVAPKNNDAEKQPETTSNKKQPETSSNKNQPETSSNKKQPETNFNKKQRESNLNRKQAESNSNKKQPETNSIEKQSETASNKKQPETGSNKKQPENNSNKVIEIDIIDLDMEDTPEKNSPMKETIEPSPNTVKQIDYLNLEDSESDIECETDDRSVPSLMDTASVLSDKPCGPEKNSSFPIVPDIPTIPPFLETHISNAVASLPEISSSPARNTPDFVRSSVSRDSAENSLSEYNSELLCGESIVKISGVPDGLNSDDSSCIFREDPQFVEASRKSAMCRIPRQIVQTHNAHTKGITSLGWCIPRFCYLYLSSSYDGSLKIWDLYRSNSVQCIKANTALRAAKWSLDGGQIVTGGYGKKALVYDVQTGKRIAEYNIYNVLASVEMHPYMEDIFLCGTKNAILGFDLRVNTTLPIRSFFSQCDEVLDIAFLDENEFICSTNTASKDSADRTIMVWDFASGAILSNQIYLELYTCPSLKVHPTDSSFIAQTNGNYIAAFSTTRPYKMKDKRYMGHKVAGYGIECDVSPDGKYVVSGDVNGSLYFYNYSTTSKVFITPERRVPTNRVRWHPVFSSTMIAATYDGQIHVWK